MIFKKWGRVVRRPGKEEEPRRGGRRWESDRKQGANGGAG